MVKKLAVTGDNHYWCILAYVLFQVHVMECYTVLSLFPLHVISCSCSLFSAVTIPCSAIYWEKLVKQLQVCEWWPTYIYSYIIVVFPLKWLLLSIVSTRHLVPLQFLAIRMSRLGMSFFTLWRLKCGFSCAELCMRVCYPNVLEAGAS